jgi:hypothetical protein
MRVTAPGIATAGSMVGERQPFGSQVLAQPDSLNQTLDVRSGRCSRGTDERGTNDAEAQELQHGAI